MKHNSRLNTVLLSMDVLGFVKILKQKSIMEKQILLSQSDIDELAANALNSAYANQMSESAFKSMKRFAGNIVAMYVDFKAYHNALTSIQVTESNVVKQIENGFTLTKGQQLLISEKAKRLSKIYIRENTKHLKCLKEMLKAFDALPEDMKESCYDALD